MTDASQALARYHELIATLPAWRTPKQDLELAEARLDYERAALLEQVRHEKSH